MAVVIGKLLLVACVLPSSFSAPDGGRFLKADPKPDTTWTDPKCIDKAGLVNTFCQIRAHSGDLATPLIAIAAIVLLPLIVIGFMSICKSSKKAGGGCFTGCFLFGLIIMALFVYEGYFWEFGPNAPSTDSMK